MTQRFFFAFLAAFILIAPLAPVQAKEAVKIPAPSREEAAKLSEGANATTEPGAQATPTGSVADADAIGVYDKALVKGEAHPWQMGHQEPASPVMVELIWLHHYVMIIITVITVAVLLLLIYVCLRFREKKNPKPHRFAHNTLVEIVWTIVPILILVAIGIPSIRAHYEYTDNENIISNPDMTLKVTGNQWYWNYEYPDFGVKYDSNIVKDEDIKEGEPRLLMVDNPVVVPVNKVVRIQLTSADVIHAWAVPAFGVKQDAVPGRLNETWFKATETGIFFGQCSELCGKYHGFMPIMVKVVSEEDFKKWIEGAKLKYAAGTHLQFAALN